MTKLTWDDNGDRLYEVGLDHGVLYLGDQPGIAWNGLTSVDETLSDFSTEAYFFDGQKMIDLPVSGDFAAKIRAYTYPDEFTEYAGYSELDAGLLQDNQNKKSFGLTYRTLIGDDISGHDLGYKIHIMYNLVATPDTIKNDTIDDTTSPIEFSWLLKSKPDAFVGFKPTAYIIADSRYMDEFLLEYLEHILYGTAGTDAKLPSLETLIFRLQEGATIFITDHNDGTWSAEGPDELVFMLDATTFQISDVNAVYLDGFTYTITTT